MCSKIIISSIQEDVIVFIYLNKKLSRRRLTQFRLKCRDRNVMRTRLLDGERVYDLQPEMADSHYGASIMYILAAIQCANAHVYNYSIPQ